MFCFLEMPATLPSFDWTTWKSYANAIPAFPAPSSFMLSIAAVVASEVASVSGTYFPMTPPIAPPSGYQTPPVPPVTMLKRLSVWARRPRSPRPTSTRR